MTNGPLTPQTMNAEIIEIKQADMLQAINRAEIDMQIATAKQYPRDLQAAINKVTTLATLDAETAQECFYILRRNGQNGQNAIEGLSVRFAEIVAGAWGNMRVQTRIIGNDGKTITAQGICHDLENNYATSVEVKRRITDRNGRTFSEDMQVVTGNAASAIAFRNAVLKVIPKAVLKKAMDEIKRVAMGQALDMETSRQNLIAYYAKLGVSEQTLLEYLGRKKRDEIDKEDVFTLRAVRNAITEGTTTAQEEIINAVERNRAENEAKQKAVTAQDKVAKAIARATGKAAAPAPSTAAAKDEAATQPEPAVDISAVTEEEAQNNARK